MSSENGTRFGMPTNEKSTPPVHFLSAQSTTFSPARLLLPQIAADSQAKCSLGMVVYGAPELSIIVVGSVGGNWSSPVLSSTKTSGGALGTAKPSHWTLISVFLIQLYDVQCNRKATKFALLRPAKAYTARTSACALCQEKG